VPVIGLGVAIQYLSPRVSLLLFSLVLGIGILIATPALLGRRPRLPRPRLTATPIPD
jgi:hypothetical protein